ncbi:MAG: MFS transporter, partial [Acidimicrobiales bacterium]
MTEAAPSTDVPAVDRAPASMFASFQRPAFRFLYIGGFVFGIGRWGLGFLAAFVANDLTGSPRAVQLTGAAMWLPLLFAGAAAGTLADRVDRRRLLVGTIVGLVPVVLTVGVLALVDRLEAWMLYPAMLVLGISWVLDITARRTLALDIVGPDLIDNAMALEALSTAVALIFGVVAGGAIVDVLGPGQAFLAVAALLLIAAAFVAATGAVDADHPPGESRVPVSRATHESDAEPVVVEPAERGMREVIASKPLQSVLGVTVLANFFFFSHTPLVPVFAERLDASAVGAGLLASALGLGMATAAVGVARLRPPRGLTYVAGAAIAMAAVIGLARATAFGPAFAASFISAIGFGMFGATQAVATMASVRPELRGRAMGMLSMAIGALPLGMFTLGEVAERIGPDDAVTMYAIAGLLA